jgi:predicted amidophosphoribosyltransferase
MGSIICPKCGEETSSNTIYCPHCGERIPQNASPAVNKPVESPIPKPILSKVYQRFLYAAIRFDSDGGGLFSKKIQVPCPFCQNQMEVRSDARNKLCPTCGKRMLLAMKKSREIKAVQCPVCQSSWGSSPDFGAFDCPDCGHPLQMAGGNVIAKPPDRQCPTCGEPISSKAFVCLKCGDLLVKPDLHSAPTRDESYDPLTMSVFIFDDNLLEGKKNDLLNFATSRIFSPLGHTVRAAWLVKITLEELANIEKSGKSDFDFLDTVKCLLRLDGAISHLMMAVELDASYPAQAERLMTIIDLLPGPAIKLSLEAGSNKFRIPIESPTYQASYKKIKKLFSDLPTGYKYLAERLKSAGYAAPAAWPVPLLDFAVCGTSVSSGYRVISGNKLMICEWETWSKNERVIQLLESKDLASLAKVFIL